MQCYGWYILVGYASVYLQPYWSSYLDIQISAVKGLNEIWIFYPQKNEIIAEKNGALTCLVTNFHVGRFLKWKYIQLQDSANYILRPWPNWHDSISHEILFSTHEWTWLYKLSRISYQTRKRLPQVDGENQSGQISTWKDFIHYQ